MMSRTNSNVSRLETCLEPVVLPMAIAAIRFAFGLMLALADIVPLFKS